MGHRGKGDVNMELNGGGVGGEVFNTHELRASSMGSCSAQECCGGGKLSQHRPCCVYA